MYQPEPSLFNILIAVARECSFVRLCVSPKIYTKISVVKIV